MKYLKKYNMFESQEYRNDSVDWELIESAKDLALEHLDIGLELEYIVSYNKLVVLDGKYSHSEDKSTWNKSVENIELDNLVYSFYFKRVNNYVGYSDLSKELTETLKEMYPNINIVEDRWSENHEVQALRIHLKDRYGMEEGDIYSISSQLYKHYGLATIYVFDNMEFISCTKETAMKIAKEYTESLDEQDLLMVKLYFRFDCVDLVSLAKYMVGDGKHYREDWEYIDDIKADEDGNIDEESFGEYMKMQIEYYKDEDGTNLVDNYGEEGALRIVKDNLTSNWLNDMTQGLIDADGLGNLLSGYDGKETIEYYEGEDYHIFRIN